MHAGLPHALPLLFLHPVHSSKPSPWCAQLYEERFQLRLLEETAVFYEAEGERLMQVGASGPF